MIAVPLRSTFATEVERREPAQMLVSVLGKWIVVSELRSKVEHGKVVRIDAERSTCTRPVLENEFEETLLRFADAVNEVKSSQ